MFALIAPLLENTIGRILLGIAVFSILTSLLATPYLIKQNFSKSREISELKDLNRDLTKKNDVLNRQVIDLKVVNTQMAKSIENQNSSITNLQEKNKEASDKAEAKLQLLEDASIKLSKSNSELRAQVSTGVLSEDCSTLNYNLNKEISKK